MGFKSNFTYFFRNFIDFGGVYESEILHLNDHLSEVIQCKTKIELYLFHGHEKKRSEKNGYSIEIG